MGTITPDLHAALQGIVPSAMVTCDADNKPNTTYISQVFYVDDDHIATSFQFFSKTKRNLQDNPRACISLIDPSCGDYLRMHVSYVRTESEGQVFDEMEMQLEAIASMQGMEDVFALAGADIYRVERVERMKVHLNAS